MEGYIGFVSQTFLTQIEDCVHTQMKSQREDNTVGESKILFTLGCSDSLNGLQGFESCELSLMF